MNRVHLAYLQSLVGNANLVLIDLIVTLTLLGGFYACARVSRRLVSAAIARTSTEGHVDHVVGAIVYYLVLVAGLVIALSRFFHVGSLVTSLGLSGVAVGFALKDVIGNYLAGLMILAQRPFTLGDSIEVGGVSGKVHAIRIRDTSIQTAAGKLVLVPNSTVFNSVLVNDSVFGRRRLSARVVVSPETGAGPAREMVMEALGRLADEYPIDEASVVFTTLSPDGLELEARCFYESSKAQGEELKSEFVVRLSAVLGEHGVEWRSSGTGEEANNGR